MRCYLAAAVKTCTSIADCAPFKWPVDIRSGINERKERFVPCTVAVGRACLLCDQPTMAKGKAKSPTSKPTEVAAAVRTEAGALWPLFGNIACAHLLQHSCDSHWPIGIIMHFHRCYSIIVLYWAVVDVAHLVCCSPRRPWT